MAILPVILDIVLAFIRALCSKVLPFSIISIPSRSTSFRDFISKSISANIFWISSSLCILPVAIMASLSYSGPIIALATSPRILLWILISSLFPFSAYSSILSISALVKGLSSPVHWSSTNSPLLFMMIFVSTSAFESSW